MLSLEALRAANVGDRNISVLASNADEWHPATRRPQRIPTRISTAGMTARRPRLAERALGPQSAARWAPMTGLGLMAIPGVGPIVAAGWLVATLAGAAAGGATGGVIGALTQAGATP